MAKRSAGILMYRGTGPALEVLLVHPGGPFWVKKDAGAWSIPKGEYDHEDPLTAAMREFAEELGRPPPQDVAAYLDLGEVMQPGRKTVRTFAVKGDFDPARLASNTLEIEWPPKSGRRRSFPEVDRAAWFSPAEAGVKILPGQAPLIERLLARIP
ncbi:MAG: NUDIX domain-containing protein [Hyphomicrobiales bacterium]